MSQPIDTTMVGWRASVLKAARKQQDDDYAEWQLSRLSPTRQGDFAYGLDWERTHGPTEET